MAQTYKVDQAATFATCVLLSIEPKLVFGSAAQDVTRDGTPKWEAQVAAGFRQYGRVVNEVIKVGLVSATNPGDEVSPYQPVELIGLEIGFMPKEAKDKETGEKRQVGVNIWCRADEIRPIAAAGNHLRKLHQAEGA